MVGTIKVRIHAANPSLPLCEAVSYVGSPSTVFIRDVPRTVGTWQITDVAVSVYYPDNSFSTVSARLSEGGVWVATIPACDVSGRIRNGFRIMASGLDEDGSPVSGYVLGVGDLAICKAFPVPTPDPGETAFPLRYFDTAPESPKKGDVAPIDGVVKMYDGTQWIAFGSEVDLSDYYTKEETDEQIDRLAAYYITYTAAGAAFPTAAALLAAETVYSGGEVRVPTRNDYAVVLADETHGGAEYRYIYAVADGETVGQWEAQYPIETNDYTALSNKPRINNTELSGNRTAANLGLATYAQGEKADSAIQGVQVNGTALTPDANKVVNITDIPKAALATAVQTSLDKADRAVLYRTDVTTAVDIGSREANTTVGAYSVAEGSNSTASGNYSHAEGARNIASGECSHAEGNSSTASGFGAHAEGSGTASGFDAHAEGSGVATGTDSHAEGNNTLAQNVSEHAQGQYNASHKASNTFGDAGNTLSSIGFGTVYNPGKNAVETMQDGKTFVYGLGGYDGTNPTGTGVKDLATAINDVTTAVDERALASDLRYSLGPTITATATLADRTMNKVVAAADNTADIKLAIPPATTGKARDFLVEITNTTGNTGDISFKRPSGVMFYGDGFSTVTPSGETWLYSFTETETNSFYVKALKMEADPTNPTYWGLYFEAEEDGAVVNMALSRSTSQTVTLESSTDGTTWTTFDPEGSTPVTLASKGDRVYFRAGAGGNTGFSRYASWGQEYYYFTLSKKCGAYGNILSLLNATDPSAVSALSDACFFKLFLDCTNLTSAPDIPATSVGINACNTMFSGCTSLIDAPLLSATTISQSCYEKMFLGCTALTSAPALPATTIAVGCYKEMFNGCTALTAAPELPATNSAKDCYNSMFYGCTALTAAPNVLPAMTLAEACYVSMFHGCSSLTTSPTLPATTMAKNCYNAMFRETSLVVAPDLPAMTLADSCYRDMFYQTRSLATAPAILPATTLAKACYYEMFGSTSITTAPKLPAMTLVDSCYSWMFYQCRQLASIEVGFTAWDPASATSIWCQTVKSTGTFRCPAALGTNETITRGANNCPTGWTVVNV